MQIEQLDTSGMGVKDYLIVILDRKWIVLLVFIVILAAALYYSETAIPIYQSTGILMSETNVMSASIFPGIDPFYYRGPLDQLTNLQRLTSTTSFATKVVKEVSQKWGVNSDLDEVMKVTLSNPKDTTLLEVVAKSDDPFKASALANSVSQVLIETTSEIKNADTHRAIAFLETQLGSMDEKLREAEEKLKNFREEEGISAGSVSTYSRGNPLNYSRSKYGIENVYQRGGLLDKLAELEGELNWVKSERELAQAQLESVNSLIAEKKDQLALNEEIDYLVGSVTPQIELLQQNIADWQLELTALQEKYTDKHYKVTELKARIEDAQDRLQSEVGILVAEKGSSLNPLSEWQNLVQQAVQLNITLKGYEEREKIAQQNIDKFREEHPDLLDREVELVRLEREAMVRQQTYMLLTEKREEMRIYEQVNAQQFTVVDEAAPATTPISPNKRRIVTLGVLLGLMLGIGIVFFLEYMDDSVKRVEDVENRLGLPIVGSIPKIQPADAPLSLPSSTGEPSQDTSGGNGERVKKLSREYRKQLEVLQGRLVKNIGLKSPVADSYRSLWTNIQFANLDKPVRSLLVTSPGPREGKSLTTANLALTMAQDGVRVLVMDGDLRRPTMHRMFGCQRSPGLSELITGDLSRMKEFVNNTYADNLYVLTSGKSPPNPVGILSSEKMMQLVEKAKDQFDIVLFDSPPLIAMADASVLASEVDLVLLVLQAGQTKRQVAFQAKEMLERLNINIFGVVFNSIDYSRRYGYYYYYYHYHDYYGREEKDDGVA